MLGSGVARGAWGAHAPPPPPHKKKKIMSICFNMLIKCFCKWLRPPQKSCLYIPKICLYHVHFTVLWICMVIPLPPPPPGKGDELFFNAPPPKKIQGPPTGKILATPLMLGPPCNIHELCQIFIKLQNALFTS